MLACTAEAVDAEGASSAEPPAGCKLVDVDGEERLFCQKVGKADTAACSDEDLASECVDEGYGCNADCLSCAACGANELSAGEGGGTGWWSCKKGTASTWGGYQSDKEWAAKEAQKKAYWACLAANGFFDVCVKHEPHCTPGWIAGFTCTAKACRKSK